MNKINITNFKICWPVHPKTIINNKCSLASKYKPCFLLMSLQIGRDPMKIEGDRKCSNVVRVMPEKGYKSM